MNTSLNGIKFGIDSSGNYGYYKVGADTVTPFKTGNESTITTFKKITIKDGTTSYSIAGWKVLVYTYRTSSSSSLEVNVIIRSLMKIYTFYLNGYKSNSTFKFNTEIKYSVNAYNSSQYSAFTITENDTVKTNGSPSIVYFT